MGLRTRLRAQIVAALPERVKPALRSVRGTVLASAATPRTRRSTRSSSRLTTAEVAVEEQYRQRLEQDPNDERAFRELVDIVRRRAAEGHEDGDPRRAADDAVWALAEEVAGNHRAWYPLIELARLSLHDDREAALRRLGTAAERDESGHALAEGLAMLRHEGMPGEALNLGVGHWRPREHSIEAGHHLVKAAVEAGRVAEARRHLKAFELHPDQGAVSRARAELEREIAAADRRSAPPA
jgi:hypothetical protein